MKQQQKKKKNLFAFHKCLVSVIANQPQQPAYLSGLLPNDQVFDDDPDDVEMPPPPSIKRIKIKKEQNKEEFDDNEDQENEEEEEEEINNGDDSEIKQDEPIDNPFLRPVKYPSTP